MKESMQIWKRLWTDGGIRRWIILFLVGILLVVIAMPVERIAGVEEKNGGQQGQTTVSKTESTGANGQEGKPWGPESENSVAVYEKELEERLEELLSRIQGAGKVQVMVTVKRSSEQILQQDTFQESSIVKETDAQGGVRDNQEIHWENQTVLIGGSSASQPYVIGEIMPVVEGVVVACEGGDRASVQAEISAAIQALFDLAPHKIKVCKMASP